MGRLNLQVKPLRELWGSERADLLRGLALASVLVLLALSANLANLWLGRTLGRRHELAVSRALGAAGWRVVAPVLGEIAVPTVLGVALGLLRTPIGLGLLQKLAVIVISEERLLGREGVITCKVGWSPYTIIK